jgi:importin subunit beta-1
MVDYLNELREGILEAYTGIVQGLKEDDNSGEGNTNCLHLLEPHLMYIMQFVAMAGQDPDHTDTIIHNCAGLIGYVFFFFFFFFNCNICMFSNCAVQRPVSGLLQ